MPTLEEVDAAVGRPVAGRGETRIRGAATAFSDVMSVSTARVVSIVLALVQTVLVTHLLKPSQYSILAYIGVMSGLMFTATASWTSSAVTRYGREELERQGTIRATSWGRLVVTTPLVVLAAFAVVALKAVGLLPKEVDSVVIAIVIGTGLASILSEHVVNLLEANGRMKLTAVAVAGGKVVSIASLAVLIALSVTHSATTIALVWLGVGWLFGAATITFVWRIGIWPPAVQTTWLRRMLAFSVPMIAFAFSQYVIQAVDIVILGAYRSTRDVGLYAIAYNGYGVLQQLATTATIVLSPLFVSLRVASKEHIIERFYRRVVPQVLLITAVCAGLGAPLLRIVVPLVFGERFASAATPLTLLLFAWILYSAASFVAPILVLHERARAMGVINLVAAVVNVVGDWLLIGRFGVGITGPAIATAGALAVIALGYFYVAANCIGQRAVFPVAVLAPGIAGVGAAMVWHGALGVSIGVALTLVTAATVIVWRRPFTASDADLIGQLDIPTAVKRRFLRALAWLG